MLGHPLHVNPTRFTLVDFLTVFAAPVHQMKQYYVYGNVDDCTGHWSKLMDCLKKKTTMFKDTVPADPMAGKHPLWELRTREEAEMFWKEQFSEAVGSKCAEKEKQTLI